jgi:hypothetical protein
MGGPTRRQIFGDRGRGAKARAEHARERAREAAREADSAEMVALVRANGGIWRAGAAVTGAAALLQKQRPLIVLDWSKYAWPAGSCRPIQHDCGDDRIRSAIGNAVRSLTQPVKVT